MDFVSLTPVMSTVYVHGRPSIGRFRSAVDGGNVSDDVAIVFPAAAARDRYVVHDSNIIAGNEGSPLGHTTGSAFGISRP